MTSAALSPSTEDYLKAVYALSGDDRAAGTTEIARALNVQPASVSGMVRRLADDGLVRHEPYRGVRLTADGRRKALGVLRRHRILETFLVERLGYRWDDVHLEAERLEHAASERLIDRMEEALGRPATDPHGAPIPTRAGTIAAAPTRSLDQAAPGRRVVVRAVPDEDPRHLRQLAAIGLVPGATAVVRGESRGEPGVVVSVGGGHRKHAVAERVASRVMVSEA